MIDGRSLFNDIIDGLDLWELKLSDRKFTWANSREIPTYEKIDRIFVQLSGNQNFP